MSVIWQWSPNWRSPLIERYEWLSDVMRSKNLTEQVQRLRSGPRVTVEFEALVHADQRRRFESALFVGQAAEWLLPIWRDVSHLPGGLPAGATSIPADTDYHSYQAGGQAVILSDGQAESVTISSVASGVVTLASPTTIDHGPGARIFPARNARLVGSDFGLTRLTDDIATMRCRFRYSDWADHAVASPATYRGLPVLEQAPNWRGDLGISYRRQLAALDYGAPAPYMENEAGRPEIVQTHRWLLGDRQVIDGYLGWLWAMRGRQSAFWLSTWAADMVLVADITSSDTSIDIAHCDYTSQLMGKRNRRDIEIVLRDGTLFRRRITTATQINATTERLGIDAPLGIAITIDQVRRISYLQVARSEADAIELSWDTDSIAASALELRVVNDDV